MHPNCLRTRHLQSQRTRIKTQQGQVSIMLALSKGLFIVLPFLLPMGEFHIEIVTETPM